MDWIKNKYYTLCEYISNASSFCCHFLLNFFLCVHRCEYIFNAPCVYCHFLLTFSFVYIGVNTSSSLHIFIVILFWTFSFSYIDVFLGNLLSRNNYTYAHNEELCDQWRLWHLNPSHISVEVRSVDIFLCCYFVEESHRLSSEVLHQQRQYLHPLPFYQYLW